jgi:hypothetical protein
MGDGHHRRHEFPWLGQPASAIGNAMEGSRTRAGGCFLTIFILLGFLYGLSIKNPLKGTLIGVGIGAIFAIITWLVDARRKK